MAYCTHFCLVHAMFAILTATLVEFIPNFTTSYAITILSINVIIFRWEAIQTSPKNEAEA